MSTLAIETDPRAVGARCTDDELIVQLADGKEDTQPNADGIVPELLSEAGFRDVREAEVVPTVSGSISLYVARKE